MKKFDIAIIGGGILGTSISYWISSIFDYSVCVIEKESSVAQHTSGRNTGVVHTPFYLDPEKKKIFAKTANISYDMWKKLAKKGNSSIDNIWKQVGTIEIALNEKQHKTLEKYLEWGIKNGVSENHLSILDSKQLKQKEKNLECNSGLFCSRDVSTNYNVLTNNLKDISENSGVSFLFQNNVKTIEKKIDSNKIIFMDNSELECNFIINCAGGNSLDIAKQFGLLKSFSDLHFRGEYWIAESKYANIVNTNIYCVAKHPEFPFLDPHWIKRADGTTEIGPNAVPVPTPETYDGFVTDIPTTLSKLAEIVTGSAKKLFLNSDFLSLISHEFQSSISKDAMVKRVKNFIPSLETDFFTKRGTAGIRTPVISPDGEFVTDVLAREGSNSFHIVNYNSPGATGAPAYSAYVVKKLQEKGILTKFKNKSDIGVDPLWNFEKTIDEI